MQMFNDCGLGRCWGKVEKGLSRLEKYFHAHLIIDPWKLGGHQSRRRFYIFLVHKKFAAKHIKNNDDLQKLLDQKLACLEASAIRPSRLGWDSKLSQHDLLQFGRVDDMLFNDDHPDVKTDVARRVLAVQRAARRAPQKKPLAIKYICQKINDNN